METQLNRDAGTFQSKIAQARSEVAGSLAALAGEVDQLVDVRAWVRKEPLAFAGAFAVAGFLLAQKPRAVSALLGRLLPAVAMAVFKPGLERFAKQLGSQIADVASNRLS